MSEIKKQSINKRAIISSVMLFAFMLLPVSGIIIHVSEGQTDSVMRHVAMSVHNMSAIIFLTAVFFHLSFNWKSLIHDMVSQKTKFFPGQKEAVIALLIVAILVGVISSHVFLAP